MRLLIACLLALSLGGCDRQKAQAPQGDAPQAEAASEDTEAPSGRLDRSKAGNPAPSAEFEDPEGGTTSLAEFRGRPLLVNLWATWCAPCVAEMPTLNALALREGQTLQVLAISQDMDGQERVDAFFAQHGLEGLEPYIDPRLKLMTELGVATLPTTILYDANGREAWRMTGMEEWTGPRAARLIAEAR